MVEIGCNGTNSDPHSDDDQISAAQMMGFGSGSNLSAYHLIFGFSLSMILGAIGEGLDVIETITHGTTYHLMLQRIYRQMMLIGLISFGLSFVTLGGSPFPTGFMNGFEFGDYTLFITAIYFCLQGLWTMVTSIGLGNAWDRASKITTEELQIDVERSNDSSRLWKRMFYPFNVTRNQVEFRIFQSIFSSSYSISTKHSELDFGLFLKMTHENNLMNIIDFDSWKGVLILVLIGVAAIKVQLYHSSCTNPVCEAEEEIWIFTCCGVVILILSMLLFYWGRRSEMLLIQKSGVESIDDYPVFLMVESQMQIQFEKNVLKTSNVKSAINELMVEAESTKLEAESKKRKHTVGRLKQTARLVATINTTTRPTPSPRDLPLPLQDSHSDSEVKTYSPPNSHRSFHLSPTPSAPPLHLQSFFNTPQSSRRGMLLFLSSRGSNNFRQETCELEVTGDPEPKVIQPNFFSRMSSRNLFSNRTPVVVPVVPVLADIEAPPPPIETHSPLHRLQPKSHPSNSYAPAPAEVELDGGHQRPRSNSSSNSSPWKKTRHLLRKLSSGDNDHEKKKIKTKIKTNFNQQKFPDVFLLHSPDTFYLILHAVITCNSLYLALWTTNSPSLPTEAITKDTQRC
jgi:hypothetical protein